MKFYSLLLIAELVSAFPQRPSRRHLIQYDSGLDPRSLFEQNLYYHYARDLDEWDNELLFIRAGKTPAKAATPAPAPKKAATPPPPAPAPKKAAAAPPPAPAAKKAAADPPPAQNKAVSPPAQNKAAAPPVQNKSTKPTTQSNTAPQGKSNPPPAAKASSATPNAKSLPAGQNAAAPKAGKTTSAPPTNGKTTSAPPTNGKTTSAPPTSGKTTASGAACKLGKRNGEGCGSPTGSQSGSRPPSRQNSWEVVAPANDPSHKNEKGDRYPIDLSQTSTTAKVLGHAISNPMEALGVAAKTVAPPTAGFVASGATKNYKPVAAGVMQGYGNLMDGTTKMEKQVIDQAKAWKDGNGNGHSISELNRMKNIDKGVKATSNAASSGWNSVKNTLGGIGRFKQGTKAPTLPAGPAPPASNIQEGYEMVDRPAAGATRKRSLYSRDTQRYVLARRALIVALKARHLEEESWY